MRGRRRRSQRGGGWPCGDYRYRRLRICGSGHYQRRHHSVGGSAQLRRGNAKMQSWLTCTSVAEVSSGQHARVHQYSRRWQHEWRERWDAPWLVASRCLSFFGRSQARLTCTALLPEQSRVNAVKSTRDDQHKTVIDDEHQRFEDAAVTAGQSQRCCGFSCCVVWTRP